MDKFDNAILERLKANPKMDDKVVSVLGARESVNALVRVRNPLHMCLIERDFRVTRAYPFISAVAIDCDIKAAIRLERMREVEYVSSQSRVFALGSPGEFAGVSVERTSDKLDGDGVNMCVLDTGISPHSDLSVPAERIVHFEDFVGDGKYPYDDNGHGTFVAGVACGNGLLSAGETRGVAPRANVVGVKVIGESGESGAFRILDGMQWLFDNFLSYGIRVVCMSFGAEPQTPVDPLKAGAEMLARSGLIVVAASGNSGVGNLRSPAISPEIISVGAVDGEDNVASFTSRGSFMGVQRPDLYAEGVDVKGVKAGGTYVRMSGTSAAAPYVAGACCLICQKYRHIAPKMAKRILLDNCRTVNGVKVFRL